MLLNVTGHELLWAPSLGHVGKEQGVLFMSHVSCWVDSRVVVPHSKNRTTADFVVSRPTGPNNFQLNCFFQIDQNVEIKQNQNQ